MPSWLYTYFGTKIAPLLFKKDGRNLLKPAIFCETQSPSFWIIPPEPVTLLASRRFEPSLYHQPRVFLWLPHFYVHELCCPHCGTVLEKNGALRPRRVTDVHDNYYIVSWAYYCRKGCRKHFAGWGRDLINSLPRYLQLAFPALLSHRSGISHEVMTLLRVGNQHKMGPTGVRALLLEMHTTRFSVLQVQYLEAIFDIVSGHETPNQSTQETLHEFLVRRFAGFGDFGSSHQYAGFVPSGRYLSDMMNKAIESDEATANQHTACLSPDQIAIDDSHKVCHVNALWIVLHLFHYVNCVMSRSISILPKLKAFQSSERCGLAWIQNSSVDKH